MNRFSILFATALLAVLLNLGGCASKTTSNIMNQPPASSGQETHDNTASATAGIQSEPVAAPSSTTLTTLDGKTLETIYFDYDAFTLKPDARRILEHHAAWLEANPAVKVIVEGHCDERGSDEYNLALGERRALAVKNYLTTLGVAGERLTTVSYGEERPAANGTGENAWAQNRRVEFK